MHDELLYNLLRRLKGRWTGKSGIGLTQAEVDEGRAVLIELLRLNAVESPSEPQGALPASPALTTGLRDPAAFYGALRRAFGGLAQSQVDGINVLLAAFAAAAWPVPFAAYGLATAWLETGHAMQPVHEKGMGDRDRDGEDDYFEKYDTGPLAERLGNTPEDDNDGGKYAGRGFPQLTGLANYRRADEKLALGGELVRNPDLAMRPDIAARIMVRGMAEGWFTGRGLADYLPSSGEANARQFEDARRIINGTDRAVEIAAIAIKFQSALQAGGWQ